MSFAKAVDRYSQDEPTKYNGGMLTNPKTGTTLYEVGDLDPSINFAIENLKVGEITEPLLYNPAPTQASGQEQKEQGYRILYLKSETQPHHANLKEDYSKIKAAASSTKQNEKIMQWFENKIKETYTFIDQDYHHCEVIQNWLKNNEQ